MKHSLVFRKTVSRKVSLTDVERFWSRVEKLDGGCWIFKGSPSARYVYFGIGPFGIGAHRFSYMLEHGFIDSSVVVMHMCDTPRCVNPDHLKAGTTMDNLEDMRSKGRGFVFPHYKGSDKTTAKLNDQQVLQIRKEFTGKYGQQRELSRKYGISDTLVSNILNGKSWKHLTT